MARESSKTIEINAGAAPHVGSLIEACMKQRGRRGLDYAAALDVHPSTLIAHRRNASMQTSLLWRFCEVLEHNFFADIASAVPAEFPSYVPPDTAEDDRIKQLEEALRIVTAERDVLLRAMGR